MTKKRRIAVCLSGQIRTSNEKLIQISEKAQEIGADVFLSVWEERGGKTFEAGPPHVSVERVFGSDAAAFFTRDWIQRFRHLFPFWPNIFPKRQPITQSDMLEIFPGASVDIEKAIPGLDLLTEKNSLRMLYKIDRCNRLKREREEREGCRYDLVVRLRPDMLVKFEDFADYDLHENDLLIFLCRGDNNLAHDKYWAGSSEVDDTMAGFFDYAKTHRVSSWKGIHEELTQYIVNSGFNQVDFRSVISDFKVFGAFTDFEKREILQNFNTELGNWRKTNEVKVVSGYNEIAAEILRYAQIRIYDQSQEDVAPGVLHKLQTLLDEHSEQKENWNLLSVVSMVYVCNRHIPPEERAKLAYFFLLDDALKWMAWLGYRAQSLAHLSPDCIVDLLPYLRSPGETDTIQSNHSDIQSMLDLWRCYRKGTAQASIVQAKKDLFQTIGKNLVIREIVFAEMVAQKRKKELLSFTSLLLEHFPNQKTAQNMAKRAQDAVDEM